MYHRYVSTRETPQAEKIPGSDQVMNNAGGYVWTVGKWDRLHRFLILGSADGTYYVGARDLTRQNADDIIDCIKEDGIRVVNEVREVSESGRAPSNDPALFVLAMCAGLGDLDTKREAFDVLPQVARIGTHLFHFLSYVEAFRGWGRGLRTAVANWYEKMETWDLLYQVVKYRQRDGWSHRDALRLSHPVPSDNGAIYRWVTSGEMGPELAGTMVEGYEKAQRATTEKEVAGIIEEYRLPWEAVPSVFLNSPVVWEVLLQRMPMTAMIRNLGKMTAIGLLKPLSDASKFVTEKVQDEPF